MADKSQNPGDAATGGVNRPSGADPNDPAVNTAYPFGTYGHGPKGKVEQPAELPGDPPSGDQSTQAFQDGTGRSPLSPLIDHERPDTSLEKAQRGDTPDHTGTR